MNSFCNTIAREVRKIDRMNSFDAERLGQKRGTEDSQSPGLERMTDS
jgi:hypothetical protein